MQILTNISRNKDNQAVEFGQLIEYNMRNIFLGKLHTKCGGETISRLFSKNSKLNLSLDQIVWSFMQFVLYAKLRINEIS